MEKIEKKRIYAREYRKRFPEKVRESFNKSIKKHPKTPRKAKERWRKNHLKEKAKLQREYTKRNIDKVNARIKAQKIKIPLNEKCELCKIKLAMERHHPNYNSPLEVMFLCIDCHRKVHNRR